MVFAAAAVERAMKLQEVLMRALGGAITWLQAADILGLTPRSMRRWRARYEAGGAVALYDQGTRRPSRRQAPAPEVQRILRLYRASASAAGTCGTSIASPDATTTCACPIAS